MRCGAAGEVFGTAAAERDEAARAFIGATGSDRPGGPLEVVTDSIPDGRNGGRGGPPGRYRARSRGPREMSGKSVSKGGDRGRKEAITTSAAPAPGSFSRPGSGRAPVRETVTLPPGTTKVGAAPVPATLSLRP